MHRFDALEDRCDRLLDLVPYFDGRYLKPGFYWENTIGTQAATFLTNEVRRHDILHLILDAHASIAVAVGDLLDVKSGRQFSVEQRTPSIGRQIWTASDGAIGTPVAVCEGTKGDGDVVLSVGITHDVRHAVEAHCQKHLPSAYCVHARFSDGTSGLSVVSGAHAWQIVEDVVGALRRVPGVPGRPIHLFAAAPNALLLFLGQQLGLRPMTVYEWDFEGAKGGGYRAGLMLG